MNKMYKLVYDKAVVKFLDKLSKNNKKQVIAIFKAINTIKDNPHVYKKMKGQFKGTKRKRQGDYRIIFDIDDKNNRIIILDIGKRNTIYKRKRS